MPQTLHTLRYFTTWGTYYGLIIGFLSGATGWVVGMMLGSIFGIMSGAVIGLILGMTTALIHRLTFHLDIDIIFHRRRLAVFNGLLVGTIGLKILLSLMESVLRRPPRGTDLDDFYSLIATFLIKTTILTVLCIAYISSHYPDWMIQTFYSPDPPRKRYHVQESFKSLVTCLDQPPQTTIVLVFGMCFYLTEILSSHEINLTGANVISQLLQSVAWSGFFMTVLFLYLILGNAVLLTFLKRLFADEDVWDVFTYHYKSIMTMTSFLLTVLMTNWYWIFAPFYMSVVSEFSSSPDNGHPVGKAMPIILGLFMAVHVSKTLAVPDSEKAKRKEKTDDDNAA